MSRSSSLAVILSLLAVAISAWIGVHVFENLPHIEDEMAYIWQAEAIADAGAMKLASPPCPTCFLVPFVVDYQGERFGKYPPGWPIVLAAGIRLGARNLVNPILAGLGIWLTYRLGKKVLGSWVGLLAAFLTLTSPFFLMNSGSLLSHPLTLVLSLAITLAWLDTFWQNEEVGQVVQTRWYRRKAPRWMTALLIPFSLGLLALTRPLTALAVGFPFAIHGLYLFVHQSASSRRLLILVGLVTLLLGLLYFIWQYALTGNALLNPYTLWWPYDKVGFGKGVGLAPGGNDLPTVVTNLYVSLKTSASDFFGWGRFSWIFLPFGIWAIRRNRQAWLISSVFLSLVVGYTAYWIGSWLLGPRYYYEGIFSVTLLSAAGIAWVAGLPKQLSNPSSPFFHAINPLRRPDFSIIFRQVRPILTATFVTLLMAVSILYYDPARIGGLKGLYGISASHLVDFLASMDKESAPSLVVVHPQTSWVEYGNLLDLETPLLDTSYIFIIDNGPELNQLAIKAFPERKVIDYYP